MSMSCSGAQAFLEVNEILDCCRLYCALLPADPGPPAIACIQVRLYRHCKMFACMLCVCVLAQARCVPLLSRIQGGRCSTASLTN